MHSEQNKTLIRRYYEDVVSTGALDEVARFVSPEYVEVHGSTRHAIGVEGAKEHIRGVRRTYADLRLTVEQQIAEGEWVVTRLTMRGTQRGEWLGIQPTGRPIEVTAVNIDRVVDGRLVEHGGAADLLGPLLAIGAVQAARRGQQAGKRPWPIVAVADVVRSSRWYTTLLDAGENHPGSPGFNQILDRDGTILLCLHRWGPSGPRGDHLWPSLSDPQDGRVGNGLLLWFVVDDFAAAWARAQRLGAAIEESPNADNGTGMPAFVVRDLDGYQVAVNEARDRT
jgi:predicted ester cyclase